MVSGWRWLEYAEPVPTLGRDASPLWKRFKKLGLVDRCTGSTFSALADRGLVSVQWHRINVHGQGVPHLRISTKGRQLARSWTGQKAHKAPPAGTLKEWHWRALAKAYAAGDEGQTWLRKSLKRLQEELATAAGGLPGEIVNGGGQLLRPSSRRTSRFF